MLICPDCNTMLLNADPVPCCHKCNWKGENRDGIISILSSLDKKNPIMNSYFENYETIAEDDLHSSIQSEKYIKNQSSNLASLINFNKNSKVCDIGSGKGYLVNALLEKGIHEVTAVDISIPYLRLFQKNIRITTVQANAENLPFIDEFDIITATDVLEHVLNIGSFLFCLNRALKIGGTAYIRVPYRENLMTYTPHFGCPYDFVHLRTFNKQLLEDCMQFSGFKVEKFRKDGFWLDVPQMFWTKTARRKKYYECLKAKILKKVKYPEDVTKWNSMLAGMLMKPNEVTVVVKKTKTLIKENYWCSYEKGKKSEEICC